MVLLTPALRALKHAYPAAQQTLWLRPRVADLMKTHPYVDACIVDLKTAGRLRSLARLVKQVCEANFDLAVVLHPTSYRNALVPFLARVPIRIGSGGNGRGILLTVACRDNGDVHEVQRYLRVVNLLGVDITTPDARLAFWHTDTDRQAVAQLLPDTDEQFIGINLGTTWETKRWRVANFAAVIQQSAQRHPDVKIVLTGSAAEGEMATALHSPGTTLNLVGKTTILQLGALIERFAVYLTCDSGPMHIAAAVGTPTVSLFGPTSPVRHGPCGNGHIMLEKPVSCRPCYRRACHRKDAPHLCMTEIREAEVADALTKFLA